MHKLTIIYPFNPIGKKAGGIETFMKGIIKYLPSNISISIVGLCNDENEFKLGQWTTIDFENRVIPFYPVMVEEDEDKRMPIPLAIRFTLALKKLMPDLTDHGLFFHRLEPAVLFLNNKHKKYFVFHNDIEKFLSKDDSEVFWAKIPWLYKRFEKLIYKYATKVLTVNGKTLSYYHETYCKRKADFDFIPTWVDTEIFYPLTDDKTTLRMQVADQYGIPNDSKWLLFVGRLQKQKAPERLVQVVSKLKNNEQLILVGDGNLKEELTVLCNELGIEDRVHFLGTLPQSEIRSLFQVADLFLLTSNFEGMPICLLEAHACGLPIVSTPVGEVARIIARKKSGEIVSDFEVDTLSEAVNNVLANPTQYSSENCIKAIEAFYAPTVIDKMFDFYYR